MRLRGFKVFKRLEDLPAWNFDKIQKTQELRYLLHLNDYHETEMSFDEKESRKLIETWIELYFEYLDKFGITEKYKNRIELERDAVILEAELALGGDPIKKTWLNIKNRELKELKEETENSKSVTFEEEIIVLMKWSGVPIDSRKINSLRFFTLRQMYNEEMSSQKLNQLMQENG
jgi:hypothetical protein